MKMVVLDGYTLNPGDLSWKGLEELGELVVHDRTPEGEILTRSAGAPVLFTNKTPLSAETISQLPELRYIGVLATGYNVVDIKAAAQRGIPVTNVPTYGTHSVAQMVFALLLDLSRHVGAHSEAVRKGDWARSIDWCFWNFPQVELDGKTMGIIGFGRIGRQVGKIASAMGMRVLAADAVHHAPEGIESFAWAEIPEVLRESDVVSLHCPLLPETEKIINRDNLKLMKRSAFLINTSRGGLVVDADLAEALNGGVIAGAGLDVLSKEPPEPTNPLLSAKNCVITPHIAWATRAARARLMDTVVANVKAFLAGKPTNVVN
ncbi:MAG: D-2-hydroxyacid dehydrogenase [Firmicutes bacterium]|nr:D-2-hydroxyacid dehydrogenase [Bacillota bacterium]